jgi:hypothetical protein
MTTELLYDKTGAAFSLDHEHNGKAYVRPMVKAITQYNDGGDVFEDEDFEPAAYLVEMNRVDLFDAPPIVALNADIVAKTEELSALKAEAKKAISELKSERSRAEYLLADAKRKLEEWMKTHKVMIDLGRLLDGQVLYPLSVSQNHYHRARDIPRIPTMRYAKYLALTSGDFEEGKKWVCKQYASDHYGSEFQFFDTEEERAAVIQSEFDITCRQFREHPNFDTTSHTSTTTLHYGTLLEWVKTHPALSIPDDIKGMKADHEAEVIRAKKAKLAAELAAMEGQSA